MTTTERDDENLLALLYGELSPTEADALRKRLAADAPESLERLRQWQRLRTLAAELPALEPDPQMHYDLVRAARLAAQPAEKQGRWWAWVEKLSWTPAFAGLLLVVVAAGLTARLTRDIEEGPAPGAGEPVMRAAKDVAAKGSAASGAAPAAAAPAAALEAKTAADLAAAAQPVVPVEPVVPPAAAPDAPGGAIGGAPEGVIGGAPPTDPAVALDARRNQDEAPAAEAPASERESDGAREESAKAVEAAPSKKAKGLSKLDFAPPPPPAASPPPEPEPRPGASAPKPTAPSRAAAARPETPTDKTNAETAGRRDTDTLADDAAGTDADAEQQAVGSNVTRDSVRPGTGFAPPPAAEPAEERSNYGDTARAPAADNAVAEPRPARARAEAPPVLMAETVATEDAAAGSAAQGAVEQRREAAGDVLTRARQASGAGDHRTAVVLYEEYISDNRGAGGLDRVWFETAQSYERLGRADRALALYRLVAAGSGAYAESARGRIEALTPPAVPPQAAPRRAVQSDDASAEPAE